MFSREQWRCHSITQRCKSLCLTLRNATDVARLGIMNPMSFTQLWPTPCVCPFTSLGISFYQQYVHYEAKLVGVWNGQRLWALAKGSWSPSLHMLLWSFEISSAVRTECPCSSSTLQRTGARGPDPQAKLFISWVNLNNTQVGGSGEAL